MSTHPALPRFRALALATALALTFGPGGLMPFGVAMAATVKKSGPTVTLNFVNAEIEGVARAMAAIVDRQIMVDPRVKGQITLYSEQPLTPREAYLNFMSALRGQGFALIEVAGLLKVVPEADAKLQTGTVEVGNSTKRAGDQIITQIFKLQNENVNNMVTVLRPLISPNNTINAIPSTNSLVITDYADNLKRLGQIIAAMDVSASTDMEALPLQHAVATDMAQVVQKLADGGGTGAPGAGGATTLVMADARTNSLLVRAPNAARLAMIRSLVQRLDKPGTNGAGGSNINVVYLRNADAVKLAAILRASFAQQGQGGSAGGAGAGSTPAPTTPTASTTAAAGGTSTTASAQSTAPVAASAQPSTGGFIQADPATNSLIITAPDALYRQLRAVIDQLDGRRAQVYIEAMIVEVSESKLAQAGIQWQGASGNASSTNIPVIGTNLGVATSSSSIPGLASASLTAASSLSGLTIPSGLNIGVVHKYSNGAYGLAALASFLQTNADGNILSKPNMIALDNEEAKIVVGQNVPFVTGSYTNGSTSSSGSVNPFTTTERKDVGLTLRVKPQVGEGGSVRMTVYQEKSSVDAASKSSTTGLITNKSAIETTVVIDDGATLVLGGLLQDSANDGSTQVPLLGDIPVIGNLFKSRARERAKTNLMVFLRPVVMRDQGASNQVTLDRYEYMTQRIQDTAPERTIMLPNLGRPDMPSLKFSEGLPMPSVRQPLDDPKAPQPTVVVPAGSPYLPKPAQP
jgi:general secretion pathway protein D